MKGIIGLEESQEITKAFRELGHEFFSCDLKPCSGGKSDWHYQDDIFQVLKDRFISLDFLGVHPVCRLLAYSGVRWLSSKKKLPGFEWTPKYKTYMNWERYEEMKVAALFFKSLLSYVQSVGKGFVENPVIHCYALEIIGIRPTQIIHPWQFGHTTKKRTCLWLVGLPKLEPTKVIPKHLRTNEIHECAPGDKRAETRSKTFPGIAKAMAEQWGDDVRVQRAVGFF
jgi:hypothetical protein